MSSAESRYRNTAAKMDNAVLTLLETKHFSQISVLEICKKAGVNRTTFYAHYDNTNELLREAVEAKLNELFEEVNAVFDSSTYFSKDYIKIFLSFIKRNDKICHIMLYNADKKIGLEVYNLIFSQIKEDFYRRGISDEKYIGYLFDYSLFGIFAIVDKWIQNGCKESIDYMTDIIWKCVLRGR